MRSGCSLILVLIILLPCLAGCSMHLIGETVGTVAETTQGVTEKDGGLLETDLNVPSRITDIDLEGENFIIAYSGNCGIFSDADYNVSRHKALDDILDLYGVEIVGENVSEDVLFQELSDAISSDSYYADLVLIPISQVGKFAEAGLLYDVSALPFLDVDSAYFNALATDSFSYGEYVFALFGDAVFEPNSLAAIYFDEAASEAAGYNLYSEVLSGSWTIEKFAEVASALGGVSSAFDEEQLAEMFFFSCGGRLAVTDEGDFDLTLPDDTEYELISRINGILYSDAFDFNFSSDVGSSLIYVDSLSHISEIADADKVYGILPFPKSAVTDGYITPVDSDTLVAVVPRNCVYPEKTAVITASLFSICDGYAYEEYVNWCLDVCLRNYDSLKSLEIIINSDYGWDFSLGFAEAFDNLNTVTLDALHFAVKNKRSRENRYNGFAELAVGELEEKFGRYGTIFKK